MTEIYVDGNLLDTDQELEIAITLGIDTIENPDSSSAAFTKSIKIPITDTNRRALGFTEQILNPILWNNQSHIAEIISDGSTIMKGAAVLTEVSMQPSKGSYYAINIIGEEIEWIKRAQTDRICDIDNPYKITYDAYNILRNPQYAGGQKTNPVMPVDTPMPIRFFPIDKGEYYTEEADDVLTPRKSLLLYDYYPFINVAECLKSIFRGWNVESSLMSKFGRMYFSGAISEVENLDLIKVNNEFTGGQGTFSYNMITESEASFIRSFSPYHNIDFNNNDGIVKRLPPSRYKNGPIKYTPRNNAAVVFDFEVSAQMEVSRNTNSQWTSFNVSIDNTLHSEYPIMYDDLEDIEHQINIADNNDMVVAVELKWEYITRIKIVREYRNAFFRTVVDERALPLFSSVNIVWFPKTEHRMGDVRWSIKAQPVYGLPVSYDITPDNSQSSLWKVGCVDGYHVNIAKKFSTQKVSILRGQTYDIYTSTSNSHSNEFQRGTILPETTMTTNFDVAVTEGDTFTLKEVGGNMLQIDLIAGLRQMFNLSLYTNALSKKIYIEPKNRFYNDIVIDLGDKIDLSKEITICDAGEGKGSFMLLQYMDGNEVVKHYNFNTESIYGSNKIALPSKTKGDGTICRNEVFMPVISRDVEMAVDNDKIIRIPMMQFVPTTEKEVSKGFEFQPDMVIMELAGIKSTSVSEGGSYMYPVAKFNGLTKEEEVGLTDIGSAENLNLSFSNSGQAAGLVQHYADNISAYSSGKVITCFVRLSQIDIENLLYPNSSGRDFRAMYRLNLDGEDILCRLEKVMDYDPRKPSTKCQFVRYVKRE